MILICARKKEKPVPRKTKKKREKCLSRPHARANHPNVGSRTLLRVDTYLLSRMLMSVVANRTCTGLRFRR